MAHVLDSASAATFHPAHPYATLEDNPSTLLKPYRGIKPDEVLILTKSKEASPWVQKQQDVEEKRAMSTKKIKRKWKMTKRISRRRKRKKKYD